MCSTNLGFSVGYATNLGFSVGVQQQMHDKINCKKESYMLSSTRGAPRDHTNVAPVDAHA